MCSINHDLKALYFHIPKTGGLYVENILERFYGFKTFYITNENHDTYVYDIKKDVHPSGFLNITKKGMVEYYKTSERFNIIANMNEEKWNTYYKFTFIREPIKRFISGFNYLHLDTSINYILNNNNSIKNYDYFHLFINQKNQLNGLTFDFIGNQETLSNDLNYVLKKLNCKIIHNKMENKKINESQKKIIPSDEEIQQLITLLQEDIDFYNSINFLQT